MKSITFCIFIIGIISSISCSRNIHLRKTNTSNSKINKSSHDIYMSKYNLYIKLKNNETQTNTFLPYMDLVLDYSVVSDGNRSYVHFSNAKNASNYNLLLESNEKFAYTNCENGIGVLLDLNDEVIKAFNINQVDHITKYESDEDTIEVNGLIIKTIPATFNLPYKVSLQLSDALNKAINLGNCYNYSTSSGIGKMYGLNSGFEVSVKLLSYRKISFDFSKYDSILSTISKNQNLDSLDFFW